MSFETYWWGFVPSWAPDMPTDKPINARAKGSAASRIFKHHRSVIPADGFYEWRREGGRKEPYFIRRCDGKPLLFAGIYDAWIAAPELYMSCTIISTSVYRDGRRAWRRRRRLDRVALVWPWSVHQS